MKIRLNLATSPLENQRRFILGAVLVGTVALAGLAAFSWRAYSSWRADYEYRSRMAQLQAEMNDFREKRRSLELFFNQPENVKLRDRSAFLNGLIEQRSFPWTKIFMDLERILPEGVRVVSIAPKMTPKGVEVKLLVGANSDENKLKFLRALEGSRDFTRIQLLAETRPTKPGESDQVMLELTTLYSST